MAHIHNRNTVRYCWVSYERFVHAVSILCPIQSTFITFTCPYFKLLHWSCIRLATLIKFLCKISFSFEKFWNWWGSCSYLFLSSFVVNLDNRGTWWNLLWCGHMNGKVIIIKIIRNYYKHFHKLLGTVNIMVLTLEFK